jgi:hypothetical protein
MSGSTTAKPSGDYIPLGGFALTRARTMNVRPAFQLVCVNCDALGIVLDHPEDAPSSAQIKCCYCGAPRGTLGDLRNLALSDRNDIFNADE